MKKVAYIMIAIALSMIATGLIFIIGERINKERCYNNTPNEFYKDEKCSKYWSKKYKALEGKYNICKKERDEYFNLYDQTYGILVDEGLVGE